MFQSSFTHSIVINAIIRFFTFVLSTSFEYMYLYLTRFSFFMTIIACHRFIFEKKNPTHVYHACIANQSTPVPQQPLIDKCQSICDGDAKHLNNIKGKFLQSKPSKYFTLLSLSLSLTLLLLLLSQYRLLGCLDWKMVCWA